MINPRRGYEEIDFEFGGNTEVYKSCSLQWQNSYYVFGGFYERRHVSIVNGNQLERKGTLDFDFSYGGCTVLPKDQSILLCFDWDETKLCRQSYDPLGSFIRIITSSFHHSQIRIASVDGENKFI